MKGIDASLAAKNIVKWYGTDDWLHLADITITGIIFAHLASVWTGKLTYLRAWKKLFYIFSK
jgi:hypothetical protein